MNKELKLTVNGQPYELSIKPKTLLVEVLRNHLGLTGTKRGCESSSCGACTVVLNGMAVKSCSILALQAEGAEVITIEGLAKLRPAFKKDGTVTAGNASGINDGAACIILMSADKAKELGVNPMAKVVSYGSGGVDPKVMGLGPVPATKKALKKAGMKLDDMDVVEANEAFASQTLACHRELNFNMDRVNLGGGAIAIGHPIGASGARILVSLLYNLKRTGKSLGLATLCVGGGMGVTAIVEMV